jgi:hypothetical protein
VNLDQLAEPSAKEKRNAQYQLDYLRRQRFSPYWPSSDGPHATVSGSLNAAHKMKDMEIKQIVSLKDVKMQKEVFPQEVWRQFMEGETKRVARNGALN